MNELLQKHGCSNVFSIPEGLRELMADITREVLREQPINICEFITNYLSALLITREHGILSMKILEDLCDCRPTVSEHLLQLDIEKETAEKLTQIIKDAIESQTEEEGGETDIVKETEIIKEILAISTLDAEMTAKVCQVARNAYREYWYTKRVMGKHLKKGPQEPWELAAEHTIEIYKKTKPSYNDLMKATRKIQAAYRGYHYRRHLLEHLKPKNRHRPKLEMPGPPLDIAESREIDLGPVLELKINTNDDVDSVISRYTGEKLQIHYDPNKTIELKQDTEYKQFSVLPETNERMILGRDLVTQTEGTNKSTRDSDSNTQRVSDSPWPFQRDLDEDDEDMLDTKSIITEAPQELKTESMYSQLPNTEGPRKKAISIIEKPKAFLIEARGEKMFFEAPKAVKEEKLTVLKEEPEESVEGTPVLEVLEDIKDEESLPTASVPTETAADDTDEDAEVIEDNEVQPQEQDD